MAEQHGEDKYIKCSKCKCKYINDDKHIDNDFGFNRLNQRYKTCVKCRTKTRKTNDLFDILPDNVVDTIHKYKHQMEFKNVMDDITNNIYVYGDCPKCKCNCDDDNELSCWLDDCLHGQSDPEWVVANGWQFIFKNRWYSLWRTEKYVPPKQNMGCCGWVDDFNDDSYYSD